MKKFFFLLLISFLSQAAFAAPVDTIKVSTETLNFSAGSFEKFEDNVDSTNFFVVDDIAEAALIAALCAEVSAEIAVESQIAALLSTFTTSVAVVGGTMTVGGVACVSYTMWNGKKVWVRAESLKTNYFAKANALYELEKLYKGKAKILSANRKEICFSVKGLSFKLNLKTFTTSLMKVQRLSDEEVKAIKNFISSKKEVNVFEEVKKLKVTSELTEEEKRREDVTRIVKEDGLISQSNYRLLSLEEVSFLKMSSRREIRVALNKYLNRKVNTLSRLSIEENKILAIISDKYRDFLLDTMIIGDKAFKTFLKKNKEDYKAVETLLFKYPREVKDWLNDRNTDLLSQKYRGKFEKGNSNSSKVSKTPNLDKSDNQRDQGGQYRGKYGIWNKDE